MVKLIRLIYIIDFTNDTEDRITDISRLTSILKQFFDCLLSIYQMILVYSEFPSTVFKISVTI